MEKKGEKGEHQKAAKIIEREGDQRKYPDDRRREPEYYTVRPVQLSGAGDSSNDERGVKTQSLPRLVSRVINCNTLSD